MSATSSELSGVNSDGLATTVLPASSAGASFHASRTTGKFHGVIAATTPSGLRTIWMRFSSSSCSTSGCDLEAGEVAEPHRRAEDLHHGDVERLALLPGEDLGDVGGARLQRGGALGAASGAAALSSVRQAG